MVALTNVNRLRSALSRYSFKSYAGTDLAVSSTRRAPQLPDVPTVAKSGFSGFNVPTWNGLMAPASTPREIVDKIAGEIGRAVKDPRFVARLDGHGADRLGNTPQHFASTIASDLALWADAMKSVGLNTR